MCHPTPRQFSGALLGVLAIMSLQGCKRIDIEAEGAPSSSTPSMVYLEDSVLTSRVRAALLLSPVVDSFNIAVESHVGAVLLSGQAADPTQLDLAVFVAQNVPGVISVESFMFAANMLPEQAADKTSSSAHAAPHAEGSRVDLARNSPQGLESAPPAENTPRQSRWVSLAHSVLGIRSIQDELLIKR